MKVLAVGMMVCDVPLSVVPRNIFELDTWEIDPPIVTTGGDALNVAVTLAKLGMDAALVGRIGRDLNGDIVLSQVEQKGVDARNIVRDEQYQTAVSYIVIDEEGERHSLSSIQIFDALSEEDVPDEAVREADIIYFGSAFLMKKMDQGGTLKLFQRAHQYGKLTAMDTAMGNFKESGRDMLKRLSPALYETDIFLPSYEEAKYLTGESKPQEIARRLEEFRFKRFGVKLGSKGCYVTDYRQEFQIPVFKDFTPRDTTGAGDSFVGGFLCGCLKGYGLYESAMLATTVAGYNIEAVGATQGVPDLLTAEAFLRDKGVRL